MKDSAILYPVPCRAALRRLRNEIGVDEDVAYKMLLMTAALMDLRPEDDRVVRMILADCGIEESEIA